MANTYTQINLHAVFSVKGKGNIIPATIRPDVFKYISGILINIDQYPLAVNGFKDHVHLFFEMRPDKSLSDIIRVVKANSSKWINENRMVKGKFSWQQGYGGFSYSRSQRNNVIQYIMKQEEHHHQKTFREEYLELLKSFEIKFEEQYIFEFYE
jgi:putative transposase